MRLLVVESPAKAKTIGKYLGSEYKVVASYGHVRDLLSKDGSVLPDDDFSMVWEVNPDGQKHMKDISFQLKSCDELLLATDPDREGEAISWHIKELLQESKKLKVPCKRIVFHEITKGAIKEAIENPRDIDSSLVDAYLARRALDYLVGFTLSPILWRKLPGSKSAGRVQSVALRIIVDREAEIEAFRKEEYWSIEGEFFAKNKKQFGAKLTHYQGEKLDKFSIANAEKANEIREFLLPQKFFVKSVETKVVKRNPAPPFITSTMQQEASRKLGFAAKKTMQTAQHLYEGIDINGETTALITYMRTDSVNLSKDAVSKIRDVIANKYGKNFLTDKPRLYQTKVKNAQEAHEAIRPVDASITPESLMGKISPDLYKLYDLIWKRAVASQMASAEFDQVQVDISDDKNNIFRANGNTLKFEGFIKVYIEGKDEQQEDDENAKGLLPPLAEGDEVPMAKLDALQHFTAPPPRFSEASLVKRLEELGIGRPSTYATIIQVLQHRGYVKLVQKFFVPEIRGRLVTSFLTSFFSKYLEYGFTADLEQSLDDISNGSKPKLEILRNFWKEFRANVDQTKDIKISDVINKLNEELGDFLFQSSENSNDDSRVCPECKAGALSLKIGRFGSFIGCSRYPECNYVRRLDSSPVTEEDKADAQSVEYPKFLGVDPSDNNEVSLRKGPYGLYIQKDIKKEEVKEELIAKDNLANDSSEDTQEIDSSSTDTTATTKRKTKKGSAKSTKSATKSSAKTPTEKPIRASVPNFINSNNIDINVALSLLKFPKMLGQHNGSDVVIGIGKFGPYVLYQGKYTSAPKTDAVLTMTLNDAIEILKNKAGKTTPRARNEK